jgi:uncharacterized protein with gpF-like domain
VANVNKSEAPVPQKAIDFLAKKIKVETEKWDDLKWGEHAHAFTVAHSAGAGVLDTLHALMSKAVADGMSFQEFRNRALDMMKEKGWYGGAGHTKDEERYVNWRIGVIYDTNMKTAYAQADYRDRMAVVDLRPIWVYNSRLTGANRRQEHIALHGKAFRWDDPAWDDIDPPNGWGCECYVTTESEHSAETAGIKVEDSKNVTLPEIDPTWKYNVGREALAPNFNRYTNLNEEVKKQIYANYHRNMNGTRISEGEFKTLLKRINEADYKDTGVQYQIGNLEAKRFKKLRRAGIEDCKIMSADKQLRQGTAKKSEGQKIAEDNWGDLYKTFNEPDHIYEEAIKGKGELYRVFHFVKDNVNGKKIKVLLRVKDMEKLQTSLNVLTLEITDYVYKDKKFIEIW